MPNTYFRFKQFTVFQDQCAMKVCTDACIFGAWVAEKSQPYARILDVGSGTGLLMLMIAQQKNSLIEGIEIEGSCYNQLKQNLNASPWAGRLTAHPGDARAFHSPEKYDLIISNPPFFEHQLKSSSPSAQMAKHSIALTFEQLLKVIIDNLKESGSFAILLSYERLKSFQAAAAQAGFHLREQLWIRQAPEREYFRAALIFSRSEAGDIAANELTIQDVQGRYTPAFTELLGAYYLNL